MTRRHMMTLTLLLALADAVTAGLVFLAVSVVRFESDTNAVWSVGISPSAAAIPFAVAWLTVGWMLGLYRLRVRWSLLAEARDVLRATVALLALTLSLLFLFHQDAVSRLFLGLLFVAQPVAATSLRALLRSRFDALGRRGRNSTYMVIAGTGTLAETFANQIERHPTLGIRVIGHLTVPVQLQRAGDGGMAPQEPVCIVTRPILGTIDQMHDIFRTHVVDEVGVCLAAASTAYLEPIVAIAADEGKTVRVPSYIEDEALHGALSEEFEGFLVRSVVHDGQREVGRALKRIVDITGAALALIVLSPLLVGTALVIRLSDGRPVLFRQVRVGLHGRPFTIYKFRTMVVDAESRFDDVAPLSDTQGAAFKMENDPRVTRIGHFVRSWTLDELPQLINVLRGEMSLVGPRPAPPREVEAYDIWHRRRLSVRPGMTGLWQVEARFDKHFDDRAELDLRYIDQWSLWMDLGILARTLPAILLRPGR
jgi:exopolysaccharide biosynthesis polyprenyl glycosylphosphotransferase